MKGTPSTPRVSVPLTGGWEAIRAEVLRRIRTRAWPPGAMIPIEEELATEFGVARATVNRALRELAESGVLERKRKSGTRVAALPVRRATLDIPVIRQEVEARGQSHAFRLLVQMQRMAPVPVTSRLALPEGSLLLWMETLHLANGQPFVLERRWLNPAILPTPAPDFSVQSVNEWLVSEVSFASGDIAFSASPADAREAEVMGVAPGTALFITERSTRTLDAPITLVRLSHAPGYCLQTAL